MTHILRNRLHELPVDSFVYENCSVNVDTFSEFCSGHAVLQVKTRSTNVVRNAGCAGSRYTLNFF